MSDLRSKCLWDHLGELSAAAERAVNSTALSLGKRHSLGTRTISTLLVTQHVMGYGCQLKLLTQAGLVHGHLWGFCDTLRESWFFHMVCCCYISCGALMTVT